MENAIIIVVLVIVIGLSGYYVYKSKKNGKKCIGCPYSSSCGTKKNGETCCSCMENTDK